MIFACTDILNQIVHNEMKSKNPEASLGSATQAAMTSVNALLNGWNQSLADKWFTQNMDMDQPRLERNASVEKLTSGRSNWKVVVGSLTAPTKSHAKWRVESEGSTLEVELLMSPEKSPKIQKLVVKAFE
jgi:hypothetical protein